MFRKQQAERLKDAIQDKASADHGAAGPWAKYYQQEARRAGARLDAIVRNSSDEERAAAARLMAIDAVYEREMDEWNRKGRRGPQPQKTRF